MLDSRATDIRDLLLDHTGFLPPRPLMQRHRTTFYSPTLRLWSEEIGADERGFFWARDQLHAVWAETSIDRAAGRRAYDRSKRHELYDPATGAWAENFLIHDQSYAAPRGLHPELLAIVIELELGADTAAHRYDRLKHRASGSHQPRWFHPDTGRWHRYGIESPEPLFVTEQLLAAIIGLRLDPGAGGTYYAQLKQEGWYDADRRQWRNARSDHRTSYAQLLGVLAESMVDRRSGCAMYDALLSSPLYDSGMNEWRHAMSPEGTVDDRRYAMAQLTDVVIRAHLAGGSPLAERHPGIPSALGVARRR